MIAGSLEVDKGVDGLWQRGKSDGWKDYSNFGRFLPKAYMQVFMSGFPFVFCDKKYWGINKRELPWDVIMPFVEEHNEKRKNLLRVVYLVADESMGVWIPKTSKSGGLPNITYEARKPDPLGTMFRNVVEGKTGIFTAHDIVQDTAGQYQKKWVDAASCLPGQKHVQAHVAQCLRLAETSNIEKGGWFGADAWFGSVGCCLALHKYLGVHSTFIVKHQTAFFPMKVLKEVLLARYGDRVAGKKVVMKTNIDGCNLFVMAYAWSQKGIAYIVSTCGTTVTHEVNYYSKFENEYGNVEVKELTRPAIAHMLYEFLPLIDEHNRQRQGILALERKWPTKNCWMRIITTLIGMSVVDEQRWDRSKRSEYNNSKDVSAELEEDFSIFQMANLIASPLKTGALSYSDKAQQTQRQKIIDPNEPLQRIIDRNGTINSEDKNGKIRSRQQSCFICRRYTPNTINTQWKCNKCGMPLCNKNREHGPDKLSCLEEHRASNNPYLGCCLMERCSFIMPKELKLYLPEEESPSKKQRKQSAQRKQPARVSPLPPRQTNGSKTKKRKVR